MTAYSDGMAAVLFPTDMHKDLSYDSSVLAHEACHVAMEHMRWLGDEEWGDEALAYLVQAVTHGLMAAHVRWLSERRS